MHIKLLRQLGQCLVALQSSQSHLCLTVKTYSSLSYIAPAPAERLPEDFHAPDYCDEMNIYFPAALL
jgi:hypothetical protein